MIARILYAFLLAVAALAPVARVAAAWPASGSYTAWSHCFKLTTQATKIDGALDWYWLDLDDMPAEFWSVVQPDGDDIVFTRNDGETPVNHRLIFIDTSVGTGLVAVAQPHGASGASVDIESYVYVGNPAASSTSTTSTFPGTMEALWMLQEAPTSASAVTDWSGNGNGSTSIAGSMTSGDLIADSPHSGLKSLDFDSNDRLVFPAALFNDCETNSAFTFWAWCKVEDEDTDVGLFASEINQFQFLHKSSGAMFAALRNSTNSGDALADSGSWQDWLLDEWAMVHVVWNGSTLKTYHNGVERASVAATSVRNTDSNFSLGRGYSVFWRGKIGESGMLSSALSAGQISTMRTNAIDSSFWIVEPVDPEAGTSWFHILVSEE